MNATVHTAKIEVRTKLAPTPVRMLVQVVRLGRVESELVIGPGRPQLVVGRRDGADIRLEDDGVSRIHGTLKLQEGGWTFLDARSTNGTYLIFRARDGTEEISRVEEQRPQLGDELGIGSDRVRLRFVDAPASLPPRHVTTLSEAGKRFEAQLAAAAGDDRPLFLLGPSGAGKTHAARRVHELSGRRGKFVDVNCAGLPREPTHLHARLLGVVPGAYTGAVKHTHGELFLADEGTLLLDEVDSLPAEAQGFLLDVIEGRGTFSQMGSEKSRLPPRFRLVAASKRSVANSGLRSDLGYRLLGGTVVTVPSLAERREDVPGFMDRFAEARVVDEIPAGQVTFSDDTYAWAVARPWPGELRQLRTVVVNGVRLAMVTQRGPVFHVGLGNLEVAARDYAAGLGTLDAPPETGEFDLPPRAAPSFRATAKLNAEDVRRALDAHGGVIEHAARSLGIARNTLKNKMKKFGLR